jgi:hypothetical protein
VELPSDSARSPTQTGPTNPVKARILIVEDERVVALDIQQAGELRPDMVMMDIRLKGDWTV